jgi:hypothetical protein
VPDTYVLLANAETSFAEIKTAVEQALGSGIMAEDWQ